MSENGAALHILQHSLGVDRHGCGAQYRNHFCTGPGSVDYPVCMRLVEQGLMARRAGSQLTGGDDLFFVTEAGKVFVRDNSPAPPKLSRGQLRYQDWLAADTGTPFGEWIKDL